MGKLGNLPGCADWRDCYLERQRSVQTASSKLTGSFDYDPPRIVAIDTGFVDVVRGPTRGGFPLRILGDNFGTKLGRVFIGEDPTNPNNKIGKECYLVVDKFNVTSQRHTEVTCLFPSGIGKDLDVIFVQRYPAESLRAQLEDTLVGGYSYYPPVIEAILPAPANAMSDNLRISGREFGDVASSVEVRIGSPTDGNNVTCSNPALAFKEYGTDLVAELRCSTGVALVGTRNVEIQVAGQVAKWEGRYDFELTCFQDYYGRNDEYCVECPRSPSTGELVADCEGRANPVAHLGWSYVPQAFATGLCHEYRMPPYTNRSECPSVTKCQGFRDDCLGHGGGLGTMEFPYDLAYLEPKGNLTCAVMPDKNQCRECVKKAKVVKRLLEWEEKLCSECYWSCHDAGTNEHFSVMSFGNRCTPSNMGELCSLCVEGFYKVNNVCTVCPNNTLLLVGIFLGVIVLLGILFWYLSRFHVNYAICNIFIDYAQVVAVFVQADVPWPGQLRAAFVYLSALNFNLVEILGVECTVALSYSDKFFGYLIAPVFFGLCCFVLFVILRCLTFCMKKGKDGMKAAENLANNVLGMYLIGFNIMYLMICRTTMDVFNCQAMVPSDGFTYMVSTHDKCYEEGGVHMSLLPFAAASLIVYSLGFPLGLAWIISRNSESIDKDMILRAKQQHHQREMSQSYCISLRYGRFYKYFRPDCKQWNFVIAMRKFFLAVTALLFRSNPTFQLSIALLGMFTAFVYQVVKRPYWSMEEREQYVRGLYEKEKALLPSAALKFLNNLNSSGARKRGNANGKNKIAPNGDDGEMNKIAPNGDDGEMNKLHYEEQKAAMDSAKSVIFNLNTIETYTLASTVIVNLSGIMLLSGQFANLAPSDVYQRDLVTYTILTIIFSSFSYLFLAFFREINFARSIGTKFTRAKWRAAIRKQIAINRRKKQAVRKFQDVVYTVMRRHNVGAYGKTSLTINILSVRHKFSLLLLFFVFLQLGL